MDKPKCLCPPVIPDHLRAPEETEERSQQPQITHLVGSIVFKPTVVGKTTKQVFRLQNESEETQAYITQRNPNTNPIYHAFDFKIAETTVASGDYLECVVTYSPQVAHQTNVDYIQILDNNFKLYEVCLKGECIGPAVHSSIKTLYFYNTAKTKLTTNMFEIKNLSNVPATFQFDVNENDPDQEIFKVDKVRGTLKEFQHTFITVKFAPKKDGFYYTTLVCLIMNHVPLMIELVGIQTPHCDIDFHKVTLRSFPQRTMEIYGYSGYTCDSAKTTVHKPPFSLSTNYLDFGRVDFQEKTNNSRILVTSLTNHLSCKLEVVWQNDNNNVFTITPEDVVIPPGESVLYECQLSPNLPDQLYSKLLTGSVYWSNLRHSAEITESSDVIDVPLSLTLRVLGHSFPENKMWLPRVDVIPNVIILPPCMPMSPSYTTFLLKSYGHLPTSFKFVPPKKSNFILKPMEGIIYDFQIVVAELHPELNDKKAFVERWGVELNGRIQDCLPLYLKGYSEYAAIVVGNNNVVTFSPVHPGCQDILPVMVKNISTHFIKYNFLPENHKYITIDHPEGELASNETVFLQWYFSGSLRAPEVSVIQCEIRTVQNSKLITGTPLHSSTKVYSKCAYSELCATPNGSDFGLVKYGTNLSTEFFLFNFGKSTLHFELVPKNSLNNAQELTILPTKGSLKHLEKVKIIVYIKALKMGQQEIDIHYKIRLNHLSDIIVNDEKEHDIFHIEYSCAYPILQIEDICSHNFGYLFSKITLWDMFNIDEINKILQTIHHDETKTVEMYLPDYELGEADFFANLLISNKSQFPTKVQLRREKICNCPLIMKSKGISLRERVYDCIHRDMLKFTLTDEFLNQNTSQKLTLDVKYLEHGLTRMLYVLSLSDNRKINIYFNINVLPEIVTMASNYGRKFELHLESAYIGEKQPPAQAFSLYNNSEAVVEYDLDVNPLKCLNFDHGFEIFKCLNPKGTISPFTSHDIIFNFTPIEACKYRVEVPFEMGHNKMFLKLFGEGTTAFQPKIHSVAQTLPSASKAQYMENPIELSTEHLVLEPFLTWSARDEMLFIRNQTSDRIIGYSWQSCTVEGVVHAEVPAKKNVLQPKESHAIIVHINSFDQPCRLRLQIVCKLLDHTQHLKHLESVIAYNRKQEELLGQFTMTENGIFYPKNNVVILPKAENFYVTLTISLVVVSLADRDLWLSRKNQLEQSPQYSLHANAKRIFQDYFQPFIPKESVLELPTLVDDENSNIGNPKTQQSCHKVNINQLDITLYSSVIESLIADVLFSEMFGKIVDVANNTSQNYYLQFKMNDGLSTTTNQHEIKHKTLDDLEKRMDLIYHFLNKPQTPFLANILNELIADGIHEIFKLGPQIKHRKHDPRIYYNAKSKFTCPVCRCNQ